MISATGLKFGGMMHSNMKQIAIENDFCMFHGTLKFPE